MGEIEWIMEWIMEWISVTGVTYMHIVDIGTRI